MTGRVGINSRHGPIAQSTEALPAQRVLTEIMRPS